MVQTPDIERIAAQVESDPGAPGFSVLADVHRRAGRLGDARRVAVAGLASNPDDLGGRLVLGLTLLELGENEAARYELARAVAEVPGHEVAEVEPDGSVTHSDGQPSLDTSSLPVIAGPALEEELREDEFERAFANAEALPEEMRNADSIAREAIAGTLLEEPEGVDAPGVFGNEFGDSFDDDFDARIGAAQAGRALGFAPERYPSYATETMAALLEDQGDTANADAIREQIEPTAADALAPAQAPAAGNQRVVQKLEHWLENIRRRRAA